MFATEKKYPESNFQKQIIDRQSHEYIAYSLCMYWVHKFEMNQKQYTTEKHKEMEYGSLLILSRLIVDLFVLEMLCTYL